MGYSKQCAPRWVIRRSGNLEHTPEASTASVAASQSGGRCAHRSSRYESNPEWSRFSFLARFAQK
jgi:hypothetical protein